MNAPPLRIRSFCKINLGLALLGRRSDGYHEIATVLQAIDLHDDLEFRPARRLALRCEGLEGVPPKENLIWRAAEALQGSFSCDRGAEIVVRKRVPVGAGLGGGSGNAAAALLALVRLWRLSASTDDLRSAAGRLGSDVPFFLEGGTALGVGRGDRLEPLPDLPPQYLTVIFPGVAVSTAEAYRSASLSLTSSDSRTRINRLCSRLRDGCCEPAEIFNDFETSILPAHPAVREAKEALVASGATAALLSGSGSSVFGFFRNEESALAASRSLVREAWRVLPAKTLNRAEYLQKMFGC